MVAFVTRSCEPCPVQSPAKYGTRWAVDMTRFPAGAAALKTLPPFSWFSETQLTWALPTLEQRRYPARTVLLRPGDKPDGIYTVLSGRGRGGHQDKQGNALVAASGRPQGCLRELR